MSFDDLQVWSELNKRSRGCQAVRNVGFGGDRCKSMKIFGGFCEHQVCRHQWKQFWCRGRYKNSNGEPVGGERPICCEMIACGVGEMCRDVSLFFSLVSW